MPFFLRCAAWGIVAAVLLGLDVRTAGAQTAADLFDDRGLHDVRLFVNTRDLQQLRARYLENVYVPADLQWRGIRVRNVAIRSRGTGSRNPSKLGLRLDFNRYARNQRFLGLTSLVLDNEWQDASMIRESLAMTVFRRLGQPAPRESFARLYINNDYQGVYALVEPIDAVFLARTLHESSGYLFEYRYLRPFYTEYLGDGLSAYKPLFEPETRSLESDAALYGPIRDLFREVNAPDDAVWRTRVEALIDLPQFVSHAAVQGVLAENDGLLGYSGINNFYLYRLAGTNRHRLLPWDEDYAFTFIPSSILRRGDQPVVLFERAFAQPDLRALFLDVADACVRLIAEDDWLAGEIDRLASLISAAVLDDQRKQFSNEAFLAEIEFLKEFAAARSAFVLGEIAALR